MKTRKNQRFFVSQKSMISVKINWLVGAVILLILSFNVAAWDTNPVYDPFETIWNKIDDQSDDIVNIENNYDSTQDTIADDGVITSDEIQDGTITDADIDSASIQERVDGTCPAGSSIRTINQDGTVTCETDDSGDSLWSQTGSDIYYNDGNVGIGDSTPDAKLDVEVSSGGAATIGNGNSATGDYAVAMGRYTTASGLTSISMGEGTTASGGYSTSMGYLSEASGYASTAMGGDTNAIGGHSTAMGRFTTASGQYSTAMGRETTASGGYSTSMGYLTNASGSVSTAMGVATTASGQASTAMGEGTNASGSYSTAMGSFTTASGYASTAMGQATTASGYASTSMGDYTTASGYASTSMGQEIEAAGSHSVAIALDDMNGAVVTQPNTMAIMGGKVGIDTVSPTEKLDVVGTVKAIDFECSNCIESENVDSASIQERVDGTCPAGSSIRTINQDGTVTCETDDSGDSLWSQTGSDIYYNDGNVGIGDSTPDAKLDVEVSSGGAATIGSSGNNATGDYAVAMGDGTTASGMYSTTMGRFTTASGSASTAMGHETTASGDYSTAIGYDTNASGYASTAIGREIEASGDYSVAMGRYTTASGYYSTAMGRYTTANGSVSTAMGHWTTASGGASTAMGQSTTASGGLSTAMGEGIEAAGEYSVAIALNDQTGTVVTQGNIMAIMGGKVGIGTVNPVTRLEVSSVMRLTPTDSPEVCIAIMKGSIYYDINLNEPCYCDGSDWKQFDTGENCY